MANVSLEPEPKKTLREYGAPSKHVMKTPIVTPEIYVDEYNIDTKLIHIVQEIFFAGREDEDPVNHLTIFDNLCSTFQQKGVSKEFVLLKLFRWSLKDKAFEWLQSLSHRCINNWDKCVTLFMQKFLLSTRSCK